MKPVVPSTEFSMMDVIGLTIPMKVPYLILCTIMEQLTTIIVIKIISGA